jgi:hypothetical protein
MIITNQIHNATDNNVSKLSGKLRSFIGKIIQWQSTMDNAKFRHVSYFKTTYGEE